MEEKGDNEQKKTAKGNVEDNSNDYGLWIG